MLHETKSRITLGLMAGALLLLPVAGQVEAGGVAKSEGTEAVLTTPATAEAHWMAAAVTGEVDEALPPVTASDLVDEGDSCLDTAAGASFGPLAEARSEEPSVGEETHAWLCPLKGNPCQYTSQCNHTYPECQYCICLRGGCYCDTWAGH